MSQIVLDEDQAATVARARDDVQVLDRQGNVLGVIVSSPFTAQDVAEALRRAASGSQRHTTQQALEHLRRMERP